VRTVNYLVNVYSITILNKAKWIIGYMCK